MYTRYHFPNQKPGEQVLLFYRRHWVGVAKIILLALFFIFIPVFFYIYFARNFDYFHNEVFYGIYVLVNSAFILFVILFTFSNFIDYYLDVWIVTNMRVINIEQLGLFARELSEKDLGRMQDVRSDTRGFWATLLNYGNVVIQTAGEEQNFVFRQIPDPEEAVRKISNLVSEYRRANVELSGGRRPERPDTEEIE